jgi:hypothetical protein
MDFTANRLARQHEAVEPLGNQSAKGIAHPLWFWPALGWPRMMVITSARFVRR